MITSWSRCSIRRSPSRSNRVCSGSRSVSVYASCGSSAMKCARLRQDWGWCTTVHHPHQGRQRHTKDRTIFLWFPAIYEVLDRPMFDKHGNPLFIEVIGNSYDTQAATGGPASVPARNAFVQSDVEPCMFYYFPYMKVTHAAGQCAVLSLYC